MVLLLPQGFTTGKTSARFEFGFIFIFGGRELRRVLDLFFVFVFEFGFGVGGREEERKELRRVQGLCLELSWVLICV